MTTQFSTDDYSILDISGKEYQAEFFSFPGTFLQYLSDSVGEITVALGSGGHGPPKEIRLTPGGSVELQDKARPFSGFYLTCEKQASAKVLVANSGIEVKPSPGRITQIGEVRRITEPVSLTSPIGGAGLVLPIDPASLTDSNGNLVSGRAIKRVIKTKPGEFGNWTGVPAHGAVLGDTAPLEWLVQDLTQATAKTNRLYPCASGDIIHFISFEVLLTPWYAYTTTGGGTDPGNNRYPLGIYLYLTDAVGNDIGPISIPHQGGATTSLLNYPSAPATRSAGLTLDPSGHAVAQLGASGISVLALSPIVDLRIKVPVPNRAGTDPNFIRNSANTSRVGLMKPGIAVEFLAVLLKKGIDF